MGGHDRGDGDCDFMVDVKNHCKDCGHWTRTGNLWGRCSTAPTGTFHHRKGYECRHTQSRYQNQSACNVRFMMKTEEMKGRGEDNERHGTVAEED